MFFICLMNIVDGIIIWKFIVKIWNLLSRIYNSYVKREYLLYYNNTFLEPLAKKLQESHFNCLYHLYTKNV